MTGNRPRGDDDLTQLPWASVFDPAANARALSAIQAQGFRAASRVVERFAELAGSVADTPRPVPRDGEDRDREDTAPATPGLNPDVDFVITTWWTIIGQMFRSMRGGVADAGGGAASVDLTTGVATGGVRLDVGGPGAAIAEVWLHNAGADAVADAAMRCSDLLAHDGAVIGAAAVRFTPAVVPMPARSSRGVGVGLELPAATAPGSYRGVILVAGLPDAWLPIVVVVSPPRP